MTHIRALYCHIPFCHTICPFCAFAVHGNKQAFHAPYLAALSREIRRQAESYKIHLAPIEALYIGGGTPSTLSIPEVAHLLDDLQKSCQFSENIEIAFEVNPEDCTQIYIEQILDLGITRISLGLQSLKDETLKKLGRNHDRIKGIEAIQALREGGCTNFNLDLLFGIPGITKKAFQEDLDEILLHHPHHISLYGLDIEPGTLYSKNSDYVAWMINNTGEQTEQFLWASEKLSSAGFRHYEVSNFSIPGFEGKQNQVVWDGENYLGFGLGAHSHLDGIRWHNQRHLRAYQTALESNHSPVADREVLTPVQRANEALMLALRRDSGLNILNWEKQFGQVWDERRNAAADGLIRDGMARFQADHLRLTPRGFMLADEITALLMDEQ